jgi:protein-L-isoaspartate(D-aspartate) O-methyltransferase
MLRQAMTNKLLADGWITSAVVEAAFRKVPRELFLPGSEFPLETVYDAHEVLRTKRAEDGTVLSSVSAPWLQARMITQAGFEPGMRVLEIGSGGFNAALLAEITGTSGHVVTMDIDPEVTARACVALEAAGYGNDRVTVVTADAARCVPGDVAYDAVIVTAGAWDLAPGWLNSITAGGALVVPLRMNGVTRSVELRRSGDHWVSASVQTCGFVPFQGATAHSAQVFPLDLPGGGKAEVRFEDHPPHALALAPDTVASDLVEEWSGVTIGATQSFADLFLWCSGFLGGFCMVTVADDEGAPDSELRRYGLGRLACACSLRNSIAWLVTRKVSGDGSAMLGARAIGPYAGRLATALVAEIDEWDRHGRDLPGDAMTYRPAGTYREPVPGKTAVYRKVCGTVTVTWPLAQDVWPRDDS